MKGGNLKARLEALEQKLWPRQVLIIRHFLGKGEPGPMMRLEVEGKVIERQPGETEEDYKERVAALAPVINGIKILRESC